VKNDFVRDGRLRVHAAGQGLFDTACKLRGPGRRNFNHLLRWRTRRHGGGTTVGQGFRLHEKPVGQARALAGIGQGFQLKRIGMLEAEFEDAPVQPLPGLYQLGRDGRGGPAMSRSRTAYQTSGAVSPVMP